MLPLPGAVCAALPGPAPSLPDPSPCQGAPVQPAAATPRPRTARSAWLMPAVAGVSLWLAGVLLLSGAIVAAQLGRWPDGSLCGLAGSALASLCDPGHAVAARAPRGLAERMLNEVDLSVWLALAGFAAAGCCVIRRT